MIIIRCAYSDNILNILESTELTELIALTQQLSPGTSAFSHTILWKHLIFKRILKHDTSKKIHKNQFKHKNT